jgi:hypothetical protein
LVGHVIGVFPPVYLHRLYWVGDHLVLYAGRAMVEFLTWGTTDDGVRATHTMIHLLRMSVLEVDNLLLQINNVSERGILKATGSLVWSPGAFLVDIKVEMDWQPYNVLEEIIAVLEVATTR